MDGWIIYRDGTVRAFLWPASVTSSLIFQDFKIRFLAWLFWTRFWTSDLEWDSSSEFTRITIAYAWLKSKSHAWVTPQCCLLYRQNLEVYPRWRVCLAWGPYDCISAFCKLGGFVGFVSQWLSAPTGDVCDQVWNSWVQICTLKGAEVMVW